jgi:hypothetical protein
VRLAAPRSPQLSPYDHDIVGDGLVQGSFCIGAAPPLLIGNPCIDKCEYDRFICSTKYI